MWSKREIDMGSGSKDKIRFVSATKYFAAKAKRVTQLNDKIKTLEKQIKELKQKGGQSNNYPKLQTLTAS